MDNLDKAIDAGIQAYRQFVTIMGKSYKHTTENFDVLVKLVEPFVERGDEVTVNLWLSAWADAHAAGTLIEPTLTADELRQIEFDAKVREEKRVADLHAKDREAGGRLNRVFLSDEEQETEIQNAEQRAREQYKQIMDRVKEVHNRPTTSNEVTVLDSLNYLKSLLAPMSVLTSGPAEKKAVTAWLRNTPSVHVIKIRKGEADLAHKMDRILMRPDPGTE